MPTEDQVRFLDAANFQIVGRKCDEQGRPFRDFYIVDSYGSRFQLFIYPDTTAGRAQFRNIQAWQNGWAPSSDFVIPEVVKTLIDPTTGTRYVLMNDEIDSPAHEISQNSKIYKPLVEMLADLPKVADNFPWQLPINLVQVKNLSRSLQGKWDEIFEQNLQSFINNLHRNVRALGLDQEEEKRFGSILQRLFGQASTFNFKTIGKGGLIGRPQLGNMGFNGKGQAVVTGFEVASPYYIKYYELASHISQRVARGADLATPGKDLAIQIIFQYKEGLKHSTKDLEHFDNNFGAVFAQRMLGELTDISSRSDVENQAYGFILDINERKEYFIKVMDQLEGFLRVGLFSFDTSEA